MEQNLSLNRIRLSKSCIGEAEQRAVMEVLESQRLGMGQRVQQFEDQLSQYFGRPTVCVVNGTAALHLALQAAGICKDDEVLIQSLTYVASFQAISATGANPIACDVNLETLAIDCEDAERKISERTRAIMPVHYGGRPGNLDKIYKLAQKYNLRIVEDAAHAFGSLYKKRLIGSIGDIACFSFDGIKNITSGEGGCIVTNDKKILDTARDARLLGVSNDSKNRYEGKRSWDFNVAAQGWRYHMSDIMAAIGSIQLERSAELFSKRKELAKHYLKRFLGSKDIKVVIDNFDEIVPHIFPVRILKVNHRDKLREHLLEQDIETGVHYKPNHMLDLYLKSNIFLPKTDLLYQELLTLPLHPDLTIDDINRVADALIDFFK